MCPGRLPSAPPPLVLVHGLFDTPRVFEHLEQHLAGRRERLLLPARPLRFGTATIQTSAQRLAGPIEAAFGANEPIESWVVPWAASSPAPGFSCWAAMSAPAASSASAAPSRRKLGSTQLRQLNADLTPLQGIACCSYGTTVDLMVVPGWSHQQLQRQPAALDSLVEELLRP